MTKQFLLHLMDLALFGISDPSTELFVYSNPPSSNKLYIILMRVNSWPPVATKKLLIGPPSMARLSECWMVPKKVTSIPWQLPDLEIILCLEEVTSQLNFGDMMTECAITMESDIVDLLLSLLLVPTRNSLSVLEVKVPFSCGKLHRK